MERGSQKRIKRLLLHSAGIHVQDMYFTVPKSEPEPVSRKSDSYDVVLDVLKRHSAIGDLLCH